MITENDFFNEISSLVHRPACWEDYTAETLWTDPHIAGRMLSFHLDPGSEPASRPHSFIDESATWIAGRFGLDAGLRVADFGCGPGLYAMRFHDAGARVTGIDFSRNSLDYARKRDKAAGRDIDYREGNYLNLPLEGPFDLITLIYCDFCALSPKQRSGLLERFRNLLAPGGRILLDVFTQEAFAGREEGSEVAAGFMSGFWCAHDYVGIRQTWKYEEERVVLDLYDIIEAERRRRVYNWLQYFDPDTLSAGFEAAGLCITEQYADVAGRHSGEGDEILAVVAEIA